MLLLLFAGLGGSEPPAVVASGADTAGNGRRKRLYLGPKPGPVAQPAPLAAPPAQPAPVAVEPYRPQLPAALQAMLRQAPQPDSTAAALELASAMVAQAREEDDDYAALVAAEMLLA